MCKKRCAEFVCVVCTLARSSIACVVAFLWMLLRPSGDSNANVGCFNSTYNASLNVCRQYACLDIKRRKKKKIKKFVNTTVTRVDADMFSENTDCSVVRNCHRRKAPSVSNCTGSLIVCSFFFSTSVKNNMQACLDVKSCVCVSRLVMEVTTGTKNCAFFFFSVAFRQWTVLWDACLYLCIGGLLISSSIRVL